MKKKIFTVEVKIGLVCVITMAVVYFGLNYMKGINIFTPSNHYFLKLDKVDGLVVSNGVFVRGYQVGQVRSISYDFSKSEPFVVDIAINDDVHLPKNTIAFLFDNSLLGEKGINLVFDSMVGDNYFASGDTLPSDIDQGLMGSLTGMIPSIQAAISHVDSLVISVDSLLNSQKISNTLTSMEYTMANLGRTSSRLDKIMATEIPSVISNLDSLSSDMRQISSQLRDVQFKDLFMSVDSTLSELNSFSQRLNSTDGTIGLLLNDAALYNNLTSTMSSANSLIIDLQKNPKRYVHFSLFGRKEKAQEK